MMKIIGIDPGTAIIGWAVIESNNSKCIPLNYGCITTSTKDSQSVRLLQLSHELSKILTKYKPDVMSIEELYFATNAKTAISVGQARGVIILTAAIKNIPVVSYTPLVIKQAISGNGKADKKQIQWMIKTTLKLKQIPKPDDAADALAIACTHAYSYKINSHYL